MGVNGILGIKLGMTQVFADDGTAVPCTVLQAGPCVVVQRRTKDKDGYDAVQLGLVEFVKPQRVNKAHDRPFQEGRTSRRCATSAKCASRIRRTKRRPATACWSMDSRSANTWTSAASARARDFRAA